MPNQLGVQAGGNGVKAGGCCTPKEDHLPQKMSVPPTKVLPIIFLPGIMGSNLRMSAKRQAILKKSNNIAWRPDRTGEALAMVNANAARRQLQLDPTETEVDIYQPATNPTGDSKESAAQRHDLGTIRVSLNPEGTSPLLTDDPVGAPNPKTKEVKAKERGWGEVYFGSYRGILEVCEIALNQPWLQSHWGRIFKADPGEWGAVSPPALKTLLEKEHKEAIKGCWFPIHAMGYNWLQSNGDSAKILSKRIRDLIEKYVEQKYQCEKVILITHSMGGLVARALIHPQIGGLESVVLGIVHGVMPASGAPAAYKRMRCGFEEAFGGLDPAPKVLGNFGSEVTAVLGNSQGGLELLPSKVYGNGWLEIRQNSVLLHSLPKENNPYSEIYKLQGKWFGLLREDWLNPAKVRGAGFKRTCDLLQGAEAFHDAIRDTYHPLSYAHYGADLFIQQADPISSEKDLAVQELNAIAASLRSRGELEIPRQPGVCIEAGFVSDPNISDYEALNIGIRLTEYPDVHLALSVTKKDALVESDALEPRLRQAEEIASHSGNAAWYSHIKTLRRGRRQIGKWYGFEMLARKPAQAEEGESHEFVFVSQGEPKNSLLPVLEIEFHTGVKENRLGGTKPSVSDDEAVAIWDKLTASIRVRPTDGQ